MNNYTRRRQHLAKVNLDVALVIHNQSSQQGHNDAGTNLWPPEVGHLLDSYNSVHGGG